MKNVTKVIYAVASVLFLSLLTFGISSCNRPEEQQPSEWYISTGGSFHRMTEKYTNVYTYTENHFWGGHVEVSSREDGGGQSYDFYSSDIDGYYSLGNEYGEIADVAVLFTFDASSKKLSAEKVADGSGGGNGDGDDNDNPTTTSYYIKHPWGGGDWTWKSMSRSGSSYVYTGVWGGTGANISTSYSGDDAEWYPESSIRGASSVSSGETVRFTFVPSSGAVGSLSVTSTGGGNGGDNGGGNGGGNSEPIPSAPTGLTATQAGPKALAYVSLSWDYNSSADHYVIYRKVSSSGSFSKLATTVASSYSDEKNITDGQTYYYKVTAANSSGQESDYSNVASVKIDKTVIEAPGIKTVSVSKGYNQITISWTYASGSGFSAPDEVRMLSSEPTWTGVTDVFSWTNASSKKSHTVKVIDLVYGNDDIKEEYSLTLQVKNSAGGGVGAKIVWRPMSNTGYYMGSLCGYKEF